jgi:hypothetical protein
MPRNPKEALLDAYAAKAVTNNARGKAREAAIQKEIKAVIRPIDTYITKCIKHVVPKRIIVFQHDEDPKKTDGIRRDFNLLRWQVEFKFQVPQRNNIIVTKLKILAQTHDCNRDSCNFPPIRELYDKYGPDGLNGFINGYHQYFGVTMSFKGDCHSSGLESNVYMANAHEGIENAIEAAVVNFTQDYLRYR